MDAPLVERFQRDGAVAIPGLFAPHWIESLRDAMPEMLKGCYAPGAVTADTGRDYEIDTTKRMDDGMWRDVEPFARFLFESPIGAAAAAAMGSSTARLYEDLLLVEEAGAEGAPGWHRDSPYWPLSGSQLASVWFSLDPVTRDTGAMRFVTGSHLDGDERVSWDVVTVPESEIEERPVKVFEAEAGDAVVFHPRALHSAYGSAPEHPRWTFTIRFMGDDVRWKPRKGFHAWMRHCGLKEGDVPDHPWLPLVAR